VAIGIDSLMLARSFRETRDSPILDASYRATGIENEGSRCAGDFFHLSEAARPDNCDELVQHFWRYKFEVHMAANGSGRLPRAFVFPSAA